MTIGDCIDYIEEFVQINNPDKEDKKSRKATQEDFNAF